MSTMTILKLNCWQNTYFCLFNFITFLPKSETLILSGMLFLYKVKYQETGGFCLYILLLMCILFCQIFNKIFHGVSSDPFKVGKYI